MTKHVKMSELIQISGLSACPCFVVSGQGHYWVTKHVKMSELIQISGLSACPGFVVSLLTSYRTCNLSL